MEEWNSSLSNSSKCVWSSYNLSWFVLIILCPSLFLDLCCESVRWKFYICSVYAATIPFKIFLNYRAEDKAHKKKFLLKRAQEEVDGKPQDAKKPIIVTYWSPCMSPIYLIEEVSFYSMHVKIYHIHLLYFMESVILIIWSYFPKHPCPLELGKTLEQKFSSK